MDNMDNMINSIYSDKLPLAINYIIEEYADITPLNTHTVEYKLKKTIQFCKHYYSLRISSALSYLMPKYLKYKKYAEENIKGFDDKKYRLALN